MLSQTPSLLTLADDAASTPAATAVFAFLGLLTLAALIGIMFPSVRKVQALFAPCVIILTIAVTVGIVAVMLIAMYKVQGA